MGVWNQCIKCLEAYDEWEKNFKLMESDKIRLCTTCREVILINEERRLKKEKQKEKQKEKPKRS